MGCSTCKNIYVQGIICNQCYTDYIEQVKKDKTLARETEKKLKNDNALARETEKKLKSQIEDLNSTLTFLRSSVSDPLVSPPPFSDIVLVASDDPSPLSVSANCDILACRSPVFRAMLENEMEESISGIIKIGDVSNDILGMFVSFVYTGEAANLDEKMACDLLMLGDKYQILHLKTYCERFLMNSILTWENALPIYAFAPRQNNSRSLMDASLSLVVKNMQNLSKRQDYAQFLEKDPRMIVELYEAYKF